MQTPWVSWVFLINLNNYYTKQLFNFDCSLLKLRSSFCRIDTSSFICCDSKLYLDTVSILRVTWARSLYSLNKKMFFQDWSAYWVMFILQQVSPWRNVLTHWGRVTHICVGNLTTIGSDNGLSPGRRQTTIWTNAGILLIDPLWTNYSEILIEIPTFSFMKMRLKVSSAKWRPFCLGLNMLKVSMCTKIPWLFQRIYLWCVSLATLPIIKTRQSITSTPHSWVTGLHTIILWFSKGMKCSRIHHFIIALKKTGNAWYTICAYCYISIQIKKIRFLH